MATCKIVSRATGKVLDVPGFNPANGVTVQQFTDNGGRNQQWQLDFVGPDLGLFKITSVATGKVLDVPGFNPADGVIIQQFTDNGGTNQQWYLVPILEEDPTRPQDLFKILSRATRKALDVPGFNPADGVLIQQFTENGGTNQQWHLVELENELLAATISFHTHDEDKDGDTHVTVTVQEDTGVVAARVDSDFGGFPNDSDNGPYNLVVVKASARSAIEAGAVTIRIDPNGDDTWRFGFSLDLTFMDRTRLVSMQQDVELSEASREQTSALL